MSLRLYERVQGDADVNGNAVLTFPTVPMVQQVWTGNVAVAGSRSGAKWVPSVEDQDWHPWIGDGAYGPLQAFPGETLKLSGSGLTPLSVLTATWIGAKTPVGATGHAVPAVSTVTQQPPVVVAPTALGTMGVLHVLVGATPPTPLTSGYGPGSFILNHGVTVQALKANAGLIYVGPANVSSSTGFELQPGQNVTLPVGDANQVYINGTSPTDGVCWIGL